VYGLADELQDSETGETTKLLHKTIKKLNEDIKQYKFNTAISTMMIFINQAEKVGITRSTYQTFITLLAPFAPHLTEEIWSILNNKDSVHLQVFPTFDPELVKDDLVTLGVQVNGKMRGQITLAPDSSEEDALSLARQESNVQTKIEGKEMIRVIYKPGRILNIIVKD
jgi:leucyl-tRNA synthetase